MNLSSPDGVRASDGSINLIYDYQRMGAKEILMAVFSEADVLQGEFKSSSTRFRARVNRATGATHSLGNEHSAITPSYMIKKAD